MTMLIVLGYTITAGAKTVAAAKIPTASIGQPMKTTVVKTPVKKKAKPKKRLPRNHDLWIRIGRCEQPGSGYKGIYWSHPGPRYQGGLGFYSGTWAAFKEPWMPSNAGAASWRAQMQVANKLYARYGTSPWGCG